MRTIIILLLVFAPYYLFAQPAPIKWKNIPFEDLEMTEYEPDPTASAVVLCDYGQMYFDVNPSGRHLFLFYDRHVRIKILNEKGIKHAKIEIPFHDLHCEKFHRESSIIINAQVYNLEENGKVVTKRIKKKDISFRDSTNCYRIAVFTIPDVEVGSVIEYQYKTPTLDLVYPKNWYFQTGIPTRHSEFRMRVPTDFQYLISPVNTQKFDVNKGQFYSKSIVFDLHRYNRGFSGSVHETKDRVTIDLSGKSYQLVKKYVPAFKCHQFLDIPDDHKQKLNIHLVKIIKNTYGPGWEDLTYSLMTTLDEYYEQKTPEQRRMIVYPPAYIIYQLPDWERLNNDLLKYDRFGLPLLKHWNYKYSLDSIIKGIENPQDKMITIYDYIRKNIKWNGQYDIYTNRIFNPLLGKVYTKITNKVVNEKSLRSPFENKTGTSSEINFILIYLLNKAGIETHPVLLSTRGNGKIDKSIPDAVQFNHVIAGVHLDGQQLLLDATDSLRPYHFLKQNSIDVEGLIVKKKDFGWVKVNNLTLSSTKISTNLTLDDQFNISGNIKQEITGYEALNLRKQILLDSNKEFLAKGIREKHPEYEVKNVLVENLEKEINPLIIETELSKDRKYKSEVFKIIPSISYKFNEVSFPDIIRKCPVNFTHPFLIEYELNIKVPEDFVAEYPQNVQYEIYGKNALFSYQIEEKKANNFNLKISIELRIHQFPAHEYKNLADFFTNINDKLKEEIVLRKRNLD